MGDSIQKEELNKALWSSCDIFRGVLEPNVYKDFVLTMLFLKYFSDVFQDLCSNYVHECHHAAEMKNELIKDESFLLPKGCDFYTLYNQRHEPGNGERINKALQVIEEANFYKLSNVFQNIDFNTTKLGNEKQKNEILCHFLEYFSRPELNMSPSRIGKLSVVGNAYEYLIKNFAATSSKTGGEFFTPPEVSELIAEIVAPKEGDEICDPTCGSGSLLLKCANQIRKSVNGSSDFVLFGQEINGSTWALAKMNMLLHGIDNHKLEWGDTIRNPKLLDEKGGLKTFDIVVSNPPFSVEKWGIEAADLDPYNRFRRGMPPKAKGDYAFILHMIETMKPKTGRMAVVMPHGVLFRGASEGKIRQKLIEENLLDAVIGLPDKLFYDTGIPAVILVFRKEKDDSKVLFIDASREVSLGKNQLSDDSVAEMVKTYKKREEKDGYSHVVDLEEIRENNFNLNIPRYINAIEEEEEVSLMALQAERKEIEAQIVQLNEQMDEYLKELGYGA